MMSNVVNLMTLPDKGSFLAKSTGIAAFAAQLFSGFPVGKTVVNGFCSGRSQNLFHILMQEIAQCQVTVVIQAAGNNGTVAEDAQLIPQTVAEHTGIPFLGG